MMNRPTMTLEVKVRKQAQKDRLGNTRVSFAAPVLVDGCLFSPSAPQDISVDRPEGVKISAVAYFPRGWAKYLRGAQVRVPNGEWLNVIGHPMDYPSEMLPQTFPWTAQVLLAVVGG